MNMFGRYCRNICRAFSNYSQSRDFGPHGLSATHTNRAGRRNLCLTLTPAHRGVTLTLACILTQLHTRAHAGNADSSVQRLHSSQWAWPGNDMCLYTLKRNRGGRMRGSHAALLQFDLQWPLIFKNFKRQIVVRWGHLRQRVQQRKWVQKDYKLSTSQTCKLENIQKYRCIQRSL